MFQSPGFGLAWSSCWSCWVNGLANGHLSCGLQDDWRGYAHESPPAICPVLNYAFVHTHGQLSGLYPCYTKLRCSVLPDKCSMLNYPQSYQSPFLEISQSPANVNKPLIRSISNPIWYPWSQVAAFFTNCLKWFCTNLSQYQCSLNKVILNLFVWILELVSRIQRERKRSEKPVKDRWKTPGDSHRCRSGGSWKPRVLSPS